jgi:RNA polymerase sigma-70 factor, ECF subfamily
MTVSKERDHLLAFEQTVLPHMDATYNLARWIMGNEQDAEDMVQEAYLRAFQYFVSFQGNNSRAWLLTIVRNTCYTWLRQNRAQELSVELNEEMVDGSHPAISPELSLMLRANHQFIRQALGNLPIEFRELIVLRELEGLSYKEIAGITGIPIGTVMSRLARARQKLRDCLFHLNNGEALHGM